MTKVKYILTNNKLKNIRITGHANFSKHGTDIVCTAISTLAQYSINLVEAFNQIDNIITEINVGLVEIEIINNSYEIDTIFTRMLEELKELEKEFPNNIKISIGG